MWKDVLHDIACKTLGPGEIVKLEKWLQEEGGEEYARDWLIEKFNFARDDLELTDEEVAKFDEYIMALSSDD